MAKKNNTLVNVKLKTQRLPHGGTQKNLGAPIKYPEPAKFAEELIRSRYEHGDPATIEEVYQSLK